MKKFVIFVFLLLFVKLVLSFEIPKDFKNQLDSLPVRVLIFSNLKELNIVFNGSYFIYKFNKLLQTGGYNIDIDNGFINFSNSLNCKELFIYPLSNIYTFSIGNNTYRGAVLLKLNKKGFIDVINYISLEQYLYATVARELRASKSGYEACKAQAVASRTLVYSKVLKNLPFYDIVSTTSSQLYQGLKYEDQLTNQAVDDTRGIVMTYKGKVLKDVLFHANCGGHTDSNENVFGGKAIPYLRGVRCVKHNLDKWHVKILKKDLFSYLESRYKLPKIKDIKFLDKDDSGRWKTLNIYFYNFKIFKIKGNSIRFYLRYKDKGVMKPLKSCKFDYIDKGSYLILNGYGWGHGVGMCQVGAITLSKQGKDFEQILKFYFKGIDFKQVYNNVNKVPIFKGDL